MNTRELGEMAQRLQSIRRHLGRMLVLVQVYQAGKVFVADFEMPLTAGQKAGIVTKFDSMVGGLKAAGNGLEALAGKTGAVQTEQLQQMQSLRVAVDGALNNLIEQATELVRNLSGTDDFAADGTITSLELPDSAAQANADVLVTLREAVKWWIAQERAKLS